MPRQHHELSDRDETMALCLARGFTRKKAAKTCNVCVKTVYNRLRDPGFRARVEERRAEMVDRTVGQLARVAGEAVSELGKLRGYPAEDVRLQAVRMALTNAVKLREHAAAEDRSADHERRTQEREERVAEIRSLNVGSLKGEGEPIDTVLVYLHAGETPREVEPPMRGA